MFPKSSMVCHWPSEHVSSSPFSSLKNPPPPEQSSMTKHKYLVVTNIHSSSWTKNVSGLALFFVVICCVSISSPTPFKQMNWTNQLHTQVKSISTMAESARGWRFEYVVNRSTNRSWFKLGIQHEHQTPTKMKTFPKLKRHNILK